MSRRGTGWRIAGCLCAAVLLAGCFKKVSYETACILKPLSQRSSGDVIEPILGAQAFAYNVDTTLWTVASYDDALNGIITSKENPSERMTAPAAVSAPYESDGASGWLQLHLSRETQMVVVADPASRVYAYTQLKSAQNLPHLYVSVVFRTWKEGNSYKDGNWSFYNEFYTPPVYLDCYIRPEVQSTEGGAAAPVPSSTPTPTTPIRPRGASPRMPTHWPARSPRRAIRRSSARRRRSRPTSSRIRTSTG